MNYIKFIIFISFICIPLPFLLHATTLYNVMNSFEDVVVTDTSAYFYGLFVCMNLATFIYTLIIGKVKTENRLKTQMIILFIISIIMFIGTIIMYFYSNQQPMAGISLLTGSMGLIYLYLCMEIPVLYITHSTNVSQTISEALTSLVVAFFNTYGVPIAVVSLKSDDIDTYLIMCMFMTCIITITIFVYLFKLMKIDELNLEENKDEILPFKVIIKSIFTDFTTYWSMIGLIFMVIGTNINFPLIVAGFLNKEVDDPLVESITIDQYINAIIPSQLIVLGLAFIPIIWGIYVKVNEVDIKDKIILNWICSNMLVIVFIVCLMGTIICIGIGDEDSLRVQTYFGASIPISFFSTCFLFYSRKYSPVNRTIIFGSGLAIASTISFVQIAMEDLYMNPLGCRLLVIIPGCILLIGLFYKLIKN